MSTGGPAFPVPDTYYPDGQLQHRNPGMTLLDWYAGQLLTGYVAHNGVSGNFDQHAKECYDLASAMLAEKARREVAVEQPSPTLPPREVDNERWAKFQDGIRIVFQPGNGWCAEIHEGSMGYGNTIADAIANLRARWEERSAAPVVQESSTTQDDGKVAELQEANRELVEFVERLAAFPLEEFGWQSRKDSQPIHGWNDYTLYVSDIKRARNLLAKHKGAA